MESSPVVSSKCKLAALIRVDKTNLWGPARLPRHSCYYVKRGLDQVAVSPSRQYYLARGSESLILLTDHSANLACDRGGIWCCHYDTQSIAARQRLVS